MDSLICGGKECGKVKEIKLEPRERCCCFAGHRPEKLKDVDSLGYELAVEAWRAMNAGFTTFITGGAKGVDIVAAESVLTVRERMNGLVKLVVALPYPTFGRRWGLEWGFRFDGVMEKADGIISVSPKCSRQAYQKRNEWMVDHSSLVLAVYNGTPGGTQNTLDYAKKRGIATKLCACEPIEMGEPEAVAEALLRKFEPWEE